MQYLEPKPGRFTKASVDKFAEQVAAEFQVEPGSDLTSFVHSLGGDIKYGWESLDEYAGGSILVRGLKDFTIVLSDLTSRKRDRFTIAHELGHYFLHYKLTSEGKNDVVMRATREKREGDPDHERAEWEANWFAAGLLMPATLFLERCDILDEGQLATYFDVSTAAIEIRKKTLIG